MARPERGRDVCCGVLGGAVAGVELSMTVGRRGRTRLVKGLVGERHGPNLLEQFRVQPLCRRGRGLS